MGRMIRKQIYIEPRQEAFLKRLAEAQGVSEAELIRRAIDGQMAQSKAPQPEPSTKTAWDEAYQFVLDLIAQGPIENARRDWTREDLYEDCIGRWDSR